MLSQLPPGAGFSDARCNLLSSETRSEASTVEPADSSAARAAVLARSMWEAVGSLLGLVASQLAVSVDTFGADNDMVCAGGFRVMHC